MRTMADKPQQFLNKVIQDRENFNMKINTAKTKIIVINKRNVRDIIALQFVTATLGNIIKKTNKILLSYSNVMSME